MEGILCRWALALQEYDFDIVHRKGSLNGNADALSRLPENHRATKVSVPLFNCADLHQSQIEDGTISEVLQTRQNYSSPPKATRSNKQPLRCYRQLWSQLQIVDGVLCRTYTPSPHTEEISVPVLPESLRADAIKLCHNIPSAGHQEFEKTLEKLHYTAYWVGIAQEVET